MDDERGTACQMQGILPVSIEYVVLPVVVYTSKRDERGYGDLVNADAAESSSVTICGNIGRSFQVRDTGNVCSVTRRFGNREYLAWRA